MIHAAHQTIHAAPFGALLAGLVNDVPRYQREKSVVSFARNSAEAPAPTAAAVALQSRIIDVIKHSAQILDVFPERKVLDATTIGYAIDSPRSTAYKALYAMAEEGLILKVMHHRMCVEWVMS